MSKKLTGWQVDKQKRKEGLEDLEDLETRKKTLEKERSKEKNIPTEEETETFMKIIGLDVIKDQIATKRDIKEVYMRINQMLELVRKVVEKLEKRKEEEMKPIKVKAKKKMVEILFLQRKKTEI